MKTLFIPLLLACLFFSSSPLAEAQKRPNRIYKQGQNDFRVGVGLLPTYLIDKAKIVLPPVTFGFDQMLTDNLSIGGQFGYSVSEFKKEYVKLERTKTYQNTSYFSSIRLAAHCTSFPEWDIYGGFDLGYARILIDAMYGDEFGEEEKHIKLLPKKSKVTYTGVLGVRYSCCKKVGFFGEIGFGVSLATAGVTYRL